MAFLQLSALASKPPTQYASALAMACQSTAQRCDETVASETTPNPKVKQSGSPISKGSAV
jgi:hypothetical protein